MLRNDMHVTAQAIALAHNHRVLVLTGKLDGENGLPKDLVQYGDGLPLRMMGSFNRFLQTAIFEILDEDALCAVIDALQCRGEHRATVMDCDGQSDPSYAL